MILILPKPPVGLTHPVYFDLPYHNNRSQSLQNPEMVSAFTAKNLLPPAELDIEQILVYLYLGSSQLYHVQHAY